MEFDKSFSPKHIHELESKVKKATPVQHHVLVGLIHGDLLNVIAVLNIKKLRLRHIIAGLTHVGLINVIVVLNVEKGLVQTNYTLDEGTSTQRKY